MEIRAYDEIYISDAQNTLGHAVDFAIMTLSIDTKSFGDAFAVSDTSKQFAKGNPRYIAGMNGCEIARKVLYETNIAFEDKEDAMYLEKSPEYWAGWALAFYQWYRNFSFLSILDSVSLEQITHMYTPYHEMDIMHFVDSMDKKMKFINPFTKLHAKRIAYGYSQAELASAAGVPLRQIQLFEQRQRDINKTSATTLFQLSQSLHCSMEDLLEV